MVNIERFIQKYMDHEYVDTHKLTNDNVNEITNILINHEPILAEIIKDNYENVEEVNSRVLLLLKVILTETDTNNSKKIWDYLISKMIASICKYLDGGDYDFSEFSRDYCELYSLFTENMVMDCLAKRDKRVNEVMKDLEKRNYENAKKMDSKILTILAGILTGDWEFEPYVAIELYKIAVNKGELVAVRELKKLFSRSLCDHTAWEYIGIYEKGIILGDAESERCLLEIFEHPMCGLIDYVTCKTNTENLLVEKIKEIEKLKKTIEEQKAYITVFNVSLKH